MSSVAGDIELETADGMVIVVSITGDALDSVTIGAEVSPLCVGALMKEDSVTMTATVVSLTPLG